MRASDVEPVQDELPAAVREELAAKWNAHPGILRLGVRITIVSRIELRAVVDPVERHHRGGMGTAAVNGPTIAAVFDLVTGLTGYLQAIGSRAGVAQLSVRFMRPVSGTRFEVVGRPARTGRSLVFVGCELLDESGAVCATAEGLVSISQAEGTGEFAL